jgi:hypothetical protein
MKTNLSDLSRAVFDFCIAHMKNSPSQFVIHMENLSDEERIALWNELNFKGKNIKWEFIFFPMWDFNLNIALEGRNILFGMRY